MFADSGQSGDPSDRLPPHTHGRRVLSRQQRHAQRRLHAHKLHTRTELVQDDQRRSSAAEPGLLRERDADGTAPGVRTEAAAAAAERRRRRIRAGTSARQGGKTALWK